MSEHRSLSEQGTKQAKSWVARQLRFQRLIEELRTPAPPATQNGACPPLND